MNLKKLTVTKYLNVRVGEPNVNATCYQYLAPGTELEVEDRIYTEQDGAEAYENDARWLRDPANNYYWIGGTNYDELEYARKGWLSKLTRNMGGVLPGDDGEGKVVAIIDTGISNTDLQRKVLFSLDYTQKSNVSPEKKEICSAPDKSGHGTAMAAIIHDIAPGVQFIIMKIGNGNEEGGIIADRITHALDYLNNNSDLDEYLSNKGLILAGVNISYEIPSDLNEIKKKGIEKHLNDIYMSKANVIIAAGNTNHAKFQEKILYPAQLNPSCKIVTFWDSDFDKLPSKFKDNVFALQDVIIKGKGKDKKEFEFGECSPYAALVTGLIARLHTGKASPSDILSEFKEKCTSIYFKNAKLKKYKIYR